METPQKDYEPHLERLVQAIDNTYQNKKALYWRSFFSGLFSGLGATIGAAIIITLLGVLIRHLGGLPVIGSYLLELNRVLPKR